MTDYHLAQLNIARMRAPLDDPVMADFVAELPRLNALADRAPGFVWRLQEEGAPDATGLRPCGPEILVNLSLWTSVDTLREYVYRTAHLEALRRRTAWFTHQGLDPHQVLWWTRAGTRPTLEQAWDRRDLLRRQGPGPRAFTMRRPFPAPENDPPTASRTAAKATTG